MRRPVGVTILALLAMLCGAPGFVWVLYLIWRVVYPREEAVPFQLTLFSLLMYAIPFTWCVIYFVVGLGLWRLRKWARRLVIYLSALGIGFVAFSFIQKQFDSDFSMPPLWLLLAQVGFYGLCLGYMFTGDVKRAFSA